MKKAIFKYNKPAEIVLTEKIIEDGLRKVQQMLRANKLPGKFEMETSVEQGKNRCGTAACIGGWLAIMLADTDDADTVNSLMGVVVEFDAYRLGDLFYGYASTARFNDPRVAAQAIERYFDRKNVSNDDVWPDGKMPGVGAVAKKRGKKK